VSRVPGPPGVQKAVSGSRAFPRGVGFFWRRRGVSPRPAAWRLRILAYRTEGEVVKDFCVVVVDGGIVARNRNGRLYSDVLVDLDYRPFEPA
jgi:hypothetical protein